MPTQRIDLSQDELPAHWYNIVPDLPEPLPEPHATKEEFELLQRVLVPECLRQEFSRERWVEIPEGLRELFVQIGRPRPLYRAFGLEKALGLPSNIRMYYKAEFLSPPGSHKLNTALTQLYFAKQHGFERGVTAQGGRITTETGAGQWGSSVAFAARLLGFREVVVYWVRNIHDWKPDRKTFMKLYGAEVVPSPSERTSAGRNALKEDPRHPGDLGIAISEGLEDAASHEGSFYVLGSVLNHVLMHQTIIGLETLAQFGKLGILPDVMISCLGGGSNFGGFVLPFVPFTLRGEKEIRFVAIQSAAAPNLQGEYRYDRADHAGLTPELKMYTLGHETKLKPVKAGGLIYHAAAPIISYLRHLGLIETDTPPLDEVEVFEAARLFAQAEGQPPPAPESAYSVWGAIKEALRAEEHGETKVIAFSVSGHGFLDLGAYAEKLAL